MAILLPAAPAMALTACVVNVKASMTNVPPFGFRVMPLFNTAGLLPKPMDIVAEDVLPKTRPVRLKFEPNITPDVAATDAAVGLPGFCGTRPGLFVTVTVPETVAITDPVIPTDPALRCTKRLPEPSTTSAEPPAKRETLPPMTVPDGAVPKLVGAPVNTVLSHSVTFVGRGFGMFRFEPTTGNICAVPEI